jgi:ankyrin repeat protein
VPLGSSARRKKTSSVKGIFGSSSCSLYQECLQKEPNPITIARLIQKCIDNPEHNSVNDLFLNHYDYANYYQTSLHLACERGLVPIVKMLLNTIGNDIDVNLVDSMGRTPLHIACLNRRHVEVLRILLRHRDVQVNIRDVHDRTPLHLTCISVSSNPEMVQELLHHPHIDVTLRDDRGWMPIHYASRDRGVDMVEKLLLHRPEKYQQIQLKAIDPDQNTPLHLSCYWTRVAKTNLLVKYTDTIHVNSMNKYGMTPLHMICSHDATYDRLQMLQHLLSHPFVMIHRTNNNGRTALDLAEERDFFDQVQILCDFWAQQRWKAYCSLMHMIQKGKSILIARNKKGG